MGIREKQGRRGRRNRLQTKVRKEIGKQWKIIWELEKNKDEGEEEINYRQK